MTTIDPTRRSPAHESLVYERRVTDPVLPPRRHEDLGGSYDYVADSPSYFDDLTHAARSAQTPAGEIEHQTQRPSADAARDDRVRDRLDAFRQRFSGPYHVPGLSGAVNARPMFRMHHSGSLNNGNVRRHWQELQAICKKNGFEAFAGLAVAGRCTPEQLVKVTQALIDAGKLEVHGEPPTAADFERAIRQMQWEWGIGVDCAGYTQQAAEYALGDAGRAFHDGRMGDIFSAMDHDPRFQKLNPWQVRAGDVIHLQNPKDGQVGHNVIVRDHRVLQPRELSEYAKKSADPEGFFSGAGPFHRIEVESSWGAADGQDFGGFRRDTWIYDEGTSRWACFDPSTGKLHVGDGPQGEVFDSAYRPKEAR